MEAELRGDDTCLQGDEHVSKQCGAGITCGQRYPNLAHRHPDLRADLEQLQSDGAALRLFQFGARECDAPQRLQQDIGNRRALQPQLIRPHLAGARAIRKQI